MGVSHWQFSTNEQTIQNSSLLASSPYFQEWRRAVQAVFDAADAHALKSNGAPFNRNANLFCSIFRMDLPVDAATRVAPLAGHRPSHQAGLLANRQFAQPPSQSLLTGQPDSAGGRSAGLLDAVRGRSGSSPANTWIIDAGKGLVDNVLSSDPRRRASRNCRRAELRKARASTGKTSRTR